MPYRDDQTALQGRRDRLQQDLAVLREGADESAALARRERALVRELAAVEAGLARAASAPSRRTRWGWAIGGVVAFATITVGLMLQYRAPAPSGLAPAPSGLASVLSGLGRPDCRELSPSESLPPAEPGLAVEWVMSGGVGGFDDHVKLYDDHRVVSMTRRGIRFSGVLRDETTERLLTLARSLEPDAQPRMTTCPPARTDAMWIGYLLYGRASRAPTQAEREELSQLTQRLRAEVAALERPKGR